MMSLRVDNQKKVTVIANPALYIDITFRHRSSACPMLPERREMRPPRSPPYICVHITTNPPPQLRDDAY